MSGRLRAVRWPLLTLALAVALFVTGFVLDGGPATARDAAIVVGVTALYVLLPIGVIWLVIAMIMYGRRR
jgi:hypothetical protein